MYQVVKVMIEGDLKENLIQITTEKSKNASFSIHISINIMALTELLLIIRNYSF